MVCADEYVLHKSLEVVIRTAFIGPASDFCIAKIESKLMQKNFALHNKMHDKNCSTVNTMVKRNTKNKHIRIERVIILREKDCFYSFYLFVLWSRILARALPCNMNSRCSRFRFLSISFLVNIHYKNGSGCTL